MVGMSAQQKPTRQPRSGAVGQWAGVVRIVRPLARGRPCQRRSPITGAGLDPRVCDPSGAPAGIPSNGSDGEGCWGGEAAGTDANVGVDVDRVVAVPEGGAGVVRIVDPRAPAQQLGDPPSTATYAHQRGMGGATSKIIRGAYGAIPQQPTASEPTARAKPTAQGPRAKGLKNLDGSLGDRDSTDANRGRCCRGPGCC